MRYRLYREHKYVSYVLSELERLVAKANVNNPLEVATIKKQLSSLQTLMAGHAEHENKSIHALLRKKGSSIHEAIEVDHTRHEKQLKALENLLDMITENTNPAEQLSLGYRFYLAYRLFVSENLKHLHEEESVIMPELQKLCTDQELRSIDFNTYALMTPEQMIHMMEVLFPHMNTSDKEVFLLDIKESEPDKFIIAWENIFPQLNREEHEILSKKLAIYI